MRPETPSGINDAHTFLSGATTDKVTVPNRPSRQAPSWTSIASHEHFERVDHAPPLPGGTTGGESAPPYELHFQAYQQREISHLTMCSTMLIIETVPSKIEFSQPAWRSG